MLSLIKRVIPSTSAKILKSTKPLLKQINALEEKISSLSDSELKEKTFKFQQSLKKNETTLSEILPEAFAVVREASKRVLGQRHYDVQIIAGIVISNADNKRRIAEMKTGEGKTLVATLPSYLNALTGKGVHVVTVNDYLAKRDAEWMGKIYNFLGLSVGCIVGEQSDAERRAAYMCDITYATNNELGFDYLRDNLKRSKNDMVQRAHNYALIDEVDCVLIDEGRTPLIISGYTEESIDVYGQANKIAQSLTTEDYEIDPESNNITMTEAGAEKAETLARKAGIMQSEGSLFDVTNSLILHRINQAMKAQYTMKKDVHYIIKNRKAMIVDEFRGRIFEGRRYSDGLHQAIEAKENLKIEQESQTIASISFQNYFRMYDKIAGMAGTAMQEEREFSEIYGLHVVEIPTHKPVARQDDPDIVFSSVEYKYKAIIDTVAECHAKEQPILIGTTSVENSEKISKMLKKAKLKHNVLNAKQHKKEAEIISNAGRLGAVTVATNMAGRGTDIILGAGDSDEYKKVCETGGLLVIGTERHESRRIDNQLRGRAGRQGDPGRSVFYLSTEDDLMKIFGIDKIGRRLSKFGWKADEPIKHKMLSSSILKAQKRIEARNYDIRKNLIKFDDVMQDQRSVVYEMRNNILSATENAIDMFHAIRERVNARIWTNAKKSEDDLFAAIAYEFHRIYGSDLRKYVTEDSITSIKILPQALNDASQKAIALHPKDEPVLKNAIISLLDLIWKEHLHSLDTLRSGIDLRSYGQQTPLNEYKKEAFKLFQDMLMNFEEGLVQSIARVHSAHHTKSTTSTSQSINAQPKNADDEHTPQNTAQNTEISNDTTSDSSNSDMENTNTSSEHQESIIKIPYNIRRNDPCPCGSERRFKHCHGKIQ